MKSLNSRFPAAELCEAGSGKEGLNPVDAFAPQLIFIDIYLPDISGFNLAKKSETPRGKPRGIFFSPPP
jgi:response regulator of citrate/malate metabolism